MDIGKSLINAAVMITIVIVAFVIVKLTDLDNKIQSLI